MFLSSNGQELHAELTDVDSWERSKNHMVGKRQWEDLWNGVEVNDNRRMYMHQVSFAKWGNGPKEEGLTTFGLSILS